MADLEISVKETINPDPSLYTHYCSVCGEWHEIDTDKTCSLPPLGINVKDTIKTKESVGGQVSRVEQLIDSLIKFLEAVKVELQKR